MRSQAGRASCSRAYRKSKSRRSISPPSTRPNWLASEILRKSSNGVLTSSMVPRTTQPIATLTRPSAAGQRSRCRKMLHV